jgi:large subunit ribosomal protein L4
MPQISIYDVNGKTKGEMKLKEEVFEIKPDVHHLHLAVKKQLNNKRVGTASTKTRAEVAGGGKKPWRQKGTGRARHGSIRSPIWKGGGVVFGPKPRDYSTKLTRKMRRLALKEALSGKVSSQNLVVIDEFRMEKISTKEFCRIIKDLKLEGKKLLFVMKDYDEIVEKSGRNISGVKIVKVEGINVYDILYYDTLVFAKKALESLEEVLS